MLLAGLAWPAAAVGSAWFGGEDPVLGADDHVADSGWYHELITREAAQAAGWRSTGAASAADALAWHADYLDSYLYNPAWMFGFRTRRLKAALMARDSLIKLHFDDLTSTDQVRVMHRRYLGGTVAALTWAAERGLIVSARNAIGAGLHAVQDFYSHSNWVDDSWRRERTWFSASPQGGLNPFSRMTSTARVLGLSDAAAQALGRQFGIRIGSGSLGHFQYAIRIADPRESMHLYTGVYEMPAHHGFKEHGKFTFDCAVLQQLPAALIEPFCALLDDNELCRRWRECRERDQVAERPTVGGVRTPRFASYLLPGGMAIDSRWMAAIARQERDLDDPTLTGDQLFDTARSLATQASREWLEELDRVSPAFDQIARAHGHGEGFWHRVKTEDRPGFALRAGIVGDALHAVVGSSPRDEQEYEDPALQPFRFLAAGDYPPAPGSSEGYWLRVDITTGAERGAGTDSDIVLRADTSAMEHLLDIDAGAPANLRRGAGRLLLWNDFERRSRAAYLVGPFPRRPSRLVLRNQPTPVAQVVAAAWGDLLATLRGALRAVKDVMLTLIGGHADYVGVNSAAWHWHDLIALSNRGRHAVTNEIDGGVEGRYLLRYSLQVQPAGADAEVTIRFRDLICRDESTTDRLSSSDEPFVLCLVSAPGANQIHRRVFGPYKRVDSGDVVPLDRHAPVRVTIPRHTGLIVAWQAWESDSEGTARRKELMEEFAATVDRDTAAQRQTVVDAAGRAIAADWLIDSVEVFCFRRDQVTEAGTVLPRQAVNRWLAPGGSLRLELRDTDLRRIQLEDT